MKAKDFELCGGGTPERIHTVVCPDCHKVWILSSVPSAWVCSEDGCGKEIEREDFIRVYAKDRDRLLLFSPAVTPHFIYRPKGDK